LRDGFALRAGLACRFLAVAGFFFVVFRRLAIEISSSRRAIALIDVVQYSRVTRRRSAGVHGVLPDSRFSA
jgi:hypothetical protein